MSGERHSGPDGGEFEERLRALLAEDAREIRPAPAPYQRIRRQGVRERKQRAAVAGAALVALTMLPVGAYALGGGSRQAGPAAASRPPVTATASPAPPASPAPSSPAGPAEPGRQLLDGITLARAADGLAKCLAYERAHSDGQQGPAPGEDLGDAAGYRIILAQRSTGDSNTPGDGIYVVAVKEQPRQTRLICNVKDGQVAEVNTSRGGVGADGAGPVAVDINSGKLYQQSFLDKGHWKLPFRWGIIGTVRPSVARVTVSYGGGTSQAVLDHGWFVATGTLHRQVTRTPHLKGYDSAGKLVYDSDHDETYEKTLP